MYNSWIVRTSGNNLISFYYSAESGICMRKYERNKWQKQTVLAGEAKERFTVNIMSDDAIYIFYQDAEGGAYCCDNQSGLWQTRPMLKARGTGRREDVAFYSFASDSRHTLVYSIPAPEEKADYIAAQYAEGDGKWSQAVRIDKFSPLPDGLFKLQVVKGDHALIFYQVKGLDNSLGYRELTSEKVGDFVRFHSTGYQISGSGFLTTDSGIYMLYSVKSMFSSQLIYRSRRPDGFTNPYVVWEAQKLANCALTIVKNVIYASFQISGVLYVCSSDDGESFSRPQKYKGPLSQSVAKGGFVSNAPLSEARYFCREIYVDKSNPWIPQMIADFYPDFYPTTSNVAPSFKIAEDAPAEKAATIERGKRAARESDRDFFNRSFDMKEDAKGEKERPDSDPNGVEALKNRLNMALQDNAEKLRQMMVMSRNFTAQSEDYAIKEMNYRIRIKDIEAELEKLGEELRTLKQERELEQEAPEKIAKEENEISVYDIYRGATEADEAEDSP